jgi:hypothetical protein
MEPVESQIVYTTHAYIQNTSRYTEGMWFFEVYGHRFYVIGDVQHLSPGDRVKITITKEPSDD